MKKLIAMTMIGALAAAAPAFADSVQDVQSDQQDVQADKGAIHKDNAAIRKDKASLANDRAAKADAKATDSYGSQAKDSVAIGADKTELSEKHTEKNVDKKILNHHENNLSEDEAKTQGNSTQN